MHITFWEIIELLILLPGTILFGWLSIPVLLANWKDWHWLLAALWTGIFARDVVLLIVQIMHRV